jgi:crotonobetainyl-CoA:carnitine CoA-transferase CaiB-like acyl-CoA transferase
MAVAIHHSLDGIRVLELGSSRAVKLAGMILKDLGAIVLRLDLSTSSQDSYSILYDRSKMVMDAAACSGSDRVDQLLARIDIIIDDNYCQEPVVTTIRERCDVAKKCIICTISTEAAGEVALHEESIGAVSGLFDTPSGIGFPRSYQLPIASTAAALHAVNAIVMALISRKRSGTGLRVSVPIEKVVYSMQIIIAMMRSNPPLHWEPFRWLSSPFTGLWKTQDNQFIYMHVAMPRHLRNFLFLLDSSGFKEEKAQIKGLLTKESKLDPMALSSLRESLKISGILDKLFRKGTAEFWEELLSNADLCCARMRSFDEWKVHPQVTESGELVPFVDADGTQCVLPGKLIKSIAGDGIALNHSEHVVMDDVVSRWNEKTIEPAGKDTPMLPLQGVKVLDMSRIIAGPFTGKTLAEYGADVIHLSIRKKQLSWEEPFHIAFNGGKKSVVVDCSRPGGKAELMRVIQQIKPDVIVHNYLDNAAAKLGIDYESMKKINPEIIYLNINGYNPDGPWGKRPGFEQCVQAASGILQTYSINTTPQILPMPFIDMSTGIVSSLAVALSFFQKLHGNGGNHVSTSLTPSAIYLQMDRLMSSDKKTITDNPSGFYRAKDTVFYCSVKDSAKSVFDEILGKSKTGTNNNYMEFIKNRLKTQPLAHWKLELSKRNICTDDIQLVTYIPMKSVLSTDLKKKDGMFAFQEHEKTGNLLTCGSPVKMISHGVVAKLTPAEPLGKSSPQFGVNSYFYPEVKNTHQVKKISKIDRIKWFLCQAKWIVVYVKAGIARKK